MPNDLVALGYEVHAVSRNRSENTEGITWHAVDLLDAAATHALVADVEATHLLHLAWVTEPGVYWQSPQNSEWFGASMNLLEEFVNHGGQRAVLAGTCFEYAWTDGHCIENETPLRAKSLYAENKLAFRDAAYALAEKSDLSVAWARVFFSFGPHERAERLVPAVIRALLAGERAKCSDGDLVRDFMYAPDVAGAMVAVLDADFRGDINIASRAAVTLEELVNRIAIKLNGTDLIDFGLYPRRPDDPQKITADVSRLYDVVGWTPGHDLDSALDKTITWWRNQAV